MKQELFYTLEQLSQVVQKLTQDLKGASVITLTGDLGAGKTTLVKKLLASWGVQEQILSPTFTYVNCYKNDQGQKIFHFDCYRITNLNQFIELGFDEYLNEPGAICLIEWPGLIKPLLDQMQPGQVFNLEIVHVSDVQRKLIIK